MKRLMILLILLLTTSGCSSSTQMPDTADTDDGNTEIIPAGDGQGQVSDIVIENGDDKNDSSNGFILYGFEEDLEDSSEDIPDATDYSQEDFDANELTFEYFDELYGQMMYTGIPEGRVPQPLKNANGVWKYDLKMVYDSSDGYMFDEIGYAQMHVNGSDDPPISITLHPRLANDGNEVWEESDEEVGYDPFAGGFDENDNIRLEGNNCVMMLKYYYAYEGKEFLIASLELSQGTNADFLMIREQQ